MKIKKIIIMITMLILILGFNSVNAAALQSNTNAPTEKAKDTWATEIRKMESLNGTLGLKETQNSNLTPTTESGSNNIDIHMQKNTEYGAMALLSASIYGKQDKVNNKETTTGNKTGVYLSDNKEWVSAHYGFIDPGDGRSTGASTIAGTVIYDNRYYNYYKNESYSITGDAMFETKGWYGSSADTGESGQPRSRNLSQYFWNFWIFK